MRSHLAIGAVIASLILAVVAPSAADAISGSPERLSGTDRYSTAVAISQQYSPGVPVVYVATGTSFADALSAAPAAAVSGGPLLLTAPSALPDVVQAELIRLKPDSIVVVGGPAAVSEAVYQQLTPLAHNIRRDAGVDRYDTSRIINALAFRGGASAAIIATGANFPDALSASAAGGAKHMPVLLVPGSASSADAPTTAALHLLGVSTTYIAGGPNAVSTGIEDSLRSSFAVERLQGSDRYATSLAINTKFFSAAQRVFFASGTGFADALAGAALAGREGAPLVTTPPFCVSYDAILTLDSWGTSLRTLLGGPVALSDAVAAGVPCSTPTFSGDADLRVGSDIPAGTYYAENTDFCYWERVTSFDGSFSSIIANDIGDGQRIVTILPGDYGFHSERCGVWRPVVAAPQLGVIPGDGVVKVGEQIPPGVYRGSNPDGDCYWARLSSFTATASSIIANGNPSGATIVQVNPGDVGFESARCGTWTKIG